MPCRLRVFIYVIYTALHPGRLLVPCGLDTHDGSAVQRGVLWGLCALHGRHVRRPLPLRTRLLLPSRLRDCQRHAVSCGLVLRVNGGRAAAVQTWLLLPVGDLGHDAAAMLLGHVWRCYGAPDARVLWHVHRRVLLPAREHKRHGGAMLRQRRVLSARSRRARYGPTAAGVCVRVVVAAAAFAFLRFACFRTHAPHSQCACVCARNEGVRLPAFSSRCECGLFVLSILST